MKLIIREYLASLRERGELDAILPDLLSQMGLNVFSRPARGTRQDGVDVGAVGCIDGGEEVVYLFSIKPGDLSRRSWDGDSQQALRPSLNEIIDSYLPNRLPVEHRSKKIVICITLGGDVLEPVRPLLAGYIAQHAKERISFEEWNGDKIASLIQSNFLREDLLPTNARSSLRKSLAMIDEPEVSYRHFADLVQALAGAGQESDGKRVTSIRQLSLCLWILFSWAREAKNTESAFLASELTLLHAWEIFKHFAGRSDKQSESVTSALLSTFSAYQQTCNSFLGQNVLPFVDKRYALSVAIRGSCSLDINIKLFDLLGRLSVDGIWSYWGVLRSIDEAGNGNERLISEWQESCGAVKNLILNNPALLLPVSDDQAIDILISSWLLLTDEGNQDFVRSWMSEMIGRAVFAIKSNGKYPCIFTSYAELLDHPASSDDEYRERATAGSVLYPAIALISSLLGDQGAYEGAVRIKKDLLTHCTFQFWYLAADSEQNLYCDRETHGATLSELAIEGSMDAFLGQIFGECKHLRHFEDLSAIKYGWWPLLMIACRHYRYPVPLHFFQKFHAGSGESSAVIPERGEVLS